MFKYDIVSQALPCLKLQSITPDKCLVFEMQGHRLDDFFFKFKNVLFPLHLDVGMNGSILSAPIDGGKDSRYLFRRVILHLNRIQLKAWAFQLNVPTLVATVSDPRVKLESDCDEQTGEQFFQHSMDHAVKIETPIMHTAKKSSLS